MSKQPKIIDKLGDIRPITECGGIILDHGDGHPNMIWFHPFGDNCRIHHIALDQRQVLGDVQQKRDVYTLKNFRNDYPYTPAEYTEWYDKDIPEIAKNEKLTVEELYSYVCSDLPWQRALFYCILADHFGWENITGAEPDIEKISKLHQRWALRFYDARKRGIDVRI